MVAQSHKKDGIWLSMVTRVLRFYKSPFIHGITSVNTLEDCSARRLLFTNVGIPALSVNSSDQSFNVLAFTIVLNPFRAGTPSGGHDRRIRHSFIVSDSAEEAR